jgi:hypothetical protein
MPKAWIYYIAVLFPLVIRVLVLDIGFAEWLWYRGHEDAYYFFSNLATNPLFLDFLGGWPLPVFVATVLCYWTMDEDHEAIPTQFLLLPIVYVPFSIIGNALSKLTFDVTTLYSHPLVLIPAGYLYLVPWIMFVHVFCKLRLLVD